MENSAHFMLKMADRASMGCWRVRIGADNLARLVQENPRIAHMKSSGHLDRNYLLGSQGDKIDAVLCGLGQNIRLLLR